MSVRGLFAQANYVMAYLPFYLGVFMMIAGGFITFVNNSDNLWYRQAAIFCAVGFLVPRRTDRILALVCTAVGAFAALN